MCKRVVYGGGSTSQSSNHAVKVDNWLYVSGTIGVRPGSDTPEEGVIKQTTQILLNLGRVLKVGRKSVVISINIYKYLLSIKRAGTSFENVLKTTVYLTDMTDFDAFKTVYLLFFKDNNPANTLVVVGPIRSNII